MNEIILSCRMNALDEWSQKIGFSSLGFGPLIFKLRILVCILELQLWIAMIEDPYSHSSSLVDGDAFWERQCLVFASLDIMERAYTNWDDCDIMRWYFLVGPLLCMCGSLLIKVALRGAWLSMKAEIEEEEEGKERERSGRRNSFIPFRVSCWTWLNDQWTLRILFQFPNTGVTAHVWFLWRCQGFEPRSTGLFVVIPCLYK